MPHGFNYSTAAMSQPKSQSVQRLEHTAPANPTMTRNNGQASVNTQGGSTGTPMRFTATGPIPGANERGQIGH